MLLYALLRTDPAAVARCRRSSCRYAQFADEVAASPDYEYAGLPGVKAAPSSRLAWCGQHGDTGPVSADDRGGADLTNPL